MAKNRNDFGIGNCSHELIEQFHLLPTSYKNKSEFIPSVTNYNFHSLNTNIYPWTSTTVKKVIQESIKYDRTIAENKSLIDQLYIEEFTDCPDESPMYNEIPYFRNTVSSGVIFMRYGSNTSSDSRTLYAFGKCNNVYEWLAIDYYKYYDVTVKRVSDGWSQEYNDLCTLDSSVYNNGQPWVTLAEYTEIIIEEMNNGERSSSDVFNGHRNNYEEIYIDEYLAPFLIIMRPKKSIDTDMSENHLLISDNRSLLISPWDSILLPQFHSDTLQEMSRRDGQGVVTIKRWTDDYLNGWTPSIHVDTTECIPLTPTYMKYYFWFPLTIINWLKIIAEELSKKHPNNNPRFAEYILRIKSSVENNSSPWKI